MVTEDGSYCLKDVMEISLTRTWDDVNKTGKVLLSVMPDMAPPPPPPP
jgi:hypothetical protein